MPTASTTRPLTKRLGLLVASSFASLLLAEVSLRIGQGECYYPHFPDSAHRIYPSAAITPGIDGPSDFTTNRFGTRGRDPDGSERLRILAIGGSTTADTVLDDREAWTACLEARLDAAAGRSGTCWVANSGIDGRASHHHLMHVLYLLPRLPKIDYVIVHAGINDLGMWFHDVDFDPDYLATPEHWDDRIGESFRVSNYTPANQPLYKHLFVWKALARLRNHFHSQATRSARGGAEPRQIVQDEQLRWLQEERARRQERGAALLPVAKRNTLPLALDSYRRTMRRIVTEVRTQGSQPILMTQALQRQFASPEERRRLWMGAVDGGSSYVTEEDYFLCLEKFNDVTRAVAAEMGTLLVDLPNAREWDGSMFYDCMHYNEAGAREVARLVADAIVRDGLLEKLAANPRR